MTTSPWCGGSGGKPRDAGPRSFAGGEVATGVCTTCQRRLRLTTSGRFRQHRPVVSAVVAAKRHPASQPKGPLPKRSKR